MTSELEKLQTLKYLIPKEAQTSQKKDLYYELHPNGLLKYYAFFEGKKKVWDVGLNQDGTSGSYGSQNYAESWHGNRIHMLTPWNDNADDSVPSDSIYEWIKPHIEFITEHGLEWMKKQSYNR